jgi:glycerol-3-phosphate dehydrogenase
MTLIDLTFQRRIERTQPFSAGCLTNSLPATIIRIHCSLGEPQSLEQIADRSHCARVHARHHGRNCCAHELEASAGALMRHWSEPAVCGAASSTRPLTHFSWLMLNTGTDTVPDQASRSPVVHLAALGLKLRINPREAKRTQVVTKTRGTRQPERADVAALHARASADVLIIGGGINGISTFRDLALQGVDVALVERGDYLSGASSASSHMIHGGIRYLENGEFRLVRESVQERNRLLKNAPHYVKPLETTIPIYSTFSGILSAPLRFITHVQGKPKERGALLIKTGLTIYDFFSRDGGAVPRHRFHGRKKSLKALPELNPTLKYTATYYDASVHEPERLGLDVLEDARAAGGDRARAANYLEAVGATEGGVTLRDKETGDEFTFAANLVVNASGPWTDLTNAAMDAPTHLMGGTKGSHIVLDNQQLFDACKDREIFFENNDGRIVLIHPLKGRVMVGTTDLEADPSQPALCTEDEVDYFFGLVAHVFPTITVDRPQIVYRFAGIRPLPKHDDTQAGFVSRDYAVVPGEIEGTPSLSLVGGKWTTFRALGEQLSDRVLEHLGVERTVSTRTLAIGGGVGFPMTPEAKDGWIAANRGTQTAERTDELLERYGTRATEVIASLTASDRPLVGDPTYSTGEIAHIATVESVVHLIDLVLRRTNHAFTGDIDVELLTELADHTGDVLGWNAARKADEVSTTSEILVNDHGMRLEARAAA